MLLPLILAVLAVGDRFGSRGSAAPVMGGRRRAWASRTATHGEIHTGRHGMADRARQTQSPSMATKGVAAMDGAMGGIVVSGVAGSSTIDWADFVQTIGTVLKQRGAASGAA